MCTRSANKPKTNSALQLSVYIFEKRRDQSISNINIRLHPFSRTCFPTNEICAWLPCYRFQRGPNLPLEIRQLSYSPLSLSLLSLRLSSCSLPHHFSPFLTLMQARTLTHILVCVTVMPWAAYWAVAAVEGKSCRANCLEQYLKSLDMINNVLRGAISYQTAHQKHISPGNYRLTFSNTFISAILDWRCLSKVLYNTVSAWTFSVGGLKMNF